jgi:hypothetical protein
MADYPKFSVSDFICWKLLPTKIGCGKDYIWSFKHAWVVHNRQNIKNAAANNNIPAFLLAGVCLVEVGGKDFTDWPAFIVRSVDWSGPSWMDSSMTITKNPAVTSMGAVSIQLRRAAEAMGMDSSTLTQQQLNTLAVALQSDVINLHIVAKHLQQLIHIDNPQSIQASHLTDEQVRLVGTRYWYGPEKSLESLKKEADKSTSYGARILQRKQLLIGLLQ